MPKENKEIWRYVCNFFSGIKGSKFLKCNWMTKKFFIRFFLILIIIAQIITMYYMIKAGKYEIQYSLGMMGFISVLMTINVVDKKINK